mgnify:CR=1 FL=1
MLVIEELPNEVQHLIWSHARRASKEWSNDIMRLNDDSDSHHYFGEEFFDELDRMTRKQSKSLHYIMYMMRVKEYELGSRKSKPPRHYLPLCRECKTCGDLRVPKEAPSWKTQCIECYKHTKYPFGVEKNLNR